MFDLVIANGRVITESGQAECDVAIRDGRIAALENDIAVSDARERLDATGQYVIPGGVDPHVHVGLALGEFTTQDGYYEATLAAALGGTTTIVDFVLPELPAGSLRAALAAHCEDAEATAAIDVAFHLIVTSADQIGEATELVGQGFPSIKIFTTYRGLVMVPLEAATQVVRAVGTAGGITFIHAEANHLIEDAEAQQLLNDTSVRGTPFVRTRLAEQSAVRTMLEVQSQTGGPIYFVHMTDPACIELIREAQSNGREVYAETCPHYMLLHDSVYSREDGHLYVCAPPIRPASVREQLAHRLDTDISTIGSDHCCYGRAQKELHKDYLPRMANGLPGVETRLPLILSDFVCRGVLSWNRFVDLIATNPAKILGLYPRKGVLAVGSDADVTVIDPAAQWDLTTDGLHMATDYTPFEGHPMTGAVRDVVSRGEIIVRQGAWVGRPGRGHVVKREPRKQSGMRY